MRDACLNLWIADHRKIMGPADNFTFLMENDLDDNSITSFDNVNKTVIGDLRKCKSIRNKEITPIGGRATGLGDESSDLDIIIWSDDDNVKGELRRLYNYYSQNYHFKVR